MKYSNARTYLQQFEKLPIMIANKTAERMMLLDLATGTTAQYGGEMVQSSGSQQKMADAVSVAADIQTEIDAMCVQYNSIRTKIESLSATEYDVIHKRYVQGWPLVTISREKKKSDGWAKTVHERALQNLERLLAEGRLDDAQAGIY